MAGSITLAGGWLPEDRKWHNMRISGKPMKYKMPGMNGLLFIVRGVCRAIAVSVADYLCWDMFK